MQKIATNVFIASSICFGIIGIAMIITGNFGPNQSDNLEPAATLINLLFTCVFLILPSFAVSVAGKYLVNKS